MASNTCRTNITLLLHTLLEVLLLAFASTALAYTPTDYILVDCGSTSNSTSTDNRRWQADTFSKLHAIEESPSIPQVPYLTAGIFLSEFTYSFPSLSPGPKFLRLYFYPAKYNQNIKTNAVFFSVTENQNTLLSNFSAFLDVASIESPLETLIKEYIIHINDTHQQLNITFLPNPSSYAFINGIEIVSIPKDLYFRGNNVPIITSTSTLFYLKNDTALETFYRLNVGGPFVPGTGDTGMFRSWIPDLDYLFDFSTLTNSRNVEVKYTSSAPAYTAPDIVYTSARFMNQNSNNMTWLFPVDSGFYYLLRLHFCEFFLEIRKPGDRMFSILINNQTVDYEVDVISWGNGPEVAVFRDYVTFVSDPDGQKRKNDLWLQMKPDPELHSLYDNALLNGLEIFKISRSNDLKRDSKKPSGSDKKMNKSWRLIVGVAGGVSLLASLMGFLIFRRPKRVNKSAIRTSVSTGGSLLPTDLCRHFSMKEIIKATGNFDDSFKIGVGGFGNVYKGYIDNGEREVAIKRSNPSSNQGKHEFLTEIEMLTKLRHVNVVSLIGYCDENSEMVLVYDYMSRGTLHDHLDNSSNPSLSWKQRLQICIGAAKGLHYLHTSARNTIIHRDVKSTNILLDENWVAKVSDFGISKVGPMAGVDTHVSTMVKGSFGYLDPEYFMYHRLTEKSDVYSFGVVLFEVLCSRAAIVQHVPTEQVNLANWVCLSNRNDTLYNIIDPQLKNEIMVESFNMYVEIGLRCLTDKGFERPTMSDVVWSLEFALQLQDATERRMNSINEGGDNGTEYDTSSVFLGLHGEAPTTGR